MPLRLASSNVLCHLDLWNMLPVPIPVPGAVATAKENRMDLALALSPLLLAQGLKLREGEDTQGTYDHQNGWSVTLDPGTENWIAIWDAAGVVACEARVSSPLQAVDLLKTFGIIESMFWVDGGDV